MIGKYEVVAEPIPHATQMLRYTVYVGKTRIGAMVSVPTESDCRFMEKPPVVPPLKVFYVTTRPGRPKKGSRPPAPLEKQQPSRDTLPSDVQLDGLERQDR
jgi:hypothetical protein